MKKKSFLTPIIGAIIVLGFTVYCPVNAQQREVRNAKGILEYTIEKDGTIRLPDGRVRGKVTKDQLEIRDSKGRIVLREQNDRIVDNTGKTKYRVTPSTITDAKGRMVATRDSTEIRVNSRLKYRIE